MGETGDACLGNKDYLCSQLWRINAMNVECDGAVDFSGNYKVTFTPQCRDGIVGGYDFRTHCEQWMGDHSQFDNGVALESELIFVDEICKPQVFTVQMGANMYFYKGDNLWTEGDKIGNGDPFLYEVGVATVYVEIVVNFPTDTMSIFDTELINVWLC